MAFGRNPWLISLDNPRVVLVPLIVDVPEEDKAWTRLVTKNATHAGYIARACSNHVALLQALKEIKGHIDMDLPVAEFDPEKAYDVATAAIKAAEAT